MSQNPNAEARLVGHYASLGDARADFRNTNLYALLAGMVRGDSVLDIGCGTGTLLGVLQRRGKAVLGLEPSGALRAQAARDNPDVSILDGEAEKVDVLVREPVDTVFMVDVLEHIESDIAQVRRVHTVLKPEGRFVVVVPAYPLLYGERDRQMGHFRRYTRRSLRAALEQGGFKVEDLRSWNALGVLPYFFSERVLHKPFDSSLREGAHSAAGRFAHALLFWWCRYIENPFSFGFGLSLIAVAKKI